MLVWTFLLNGGLNHIMFLCLFLLLVADSGDCCCGGVNLRQNLILLLLFKFEFCGDHAADVFGPWRLQCVWGLTDEWISSLLVCEADLCWGPCGAALGGGALLLPLHHCWALFWIYQCKTHLKSYIYIYVWIYENGVKDWIRCFFDFFVFFISLLVFFCFCYDRSLQILSSTKCRNYLPYVSFV